MHDAGVWLPESFVPLTGSEIPHVARSKAALTRLSLRGCADPGPHRGAPSRWPDSCSVRLSMASSAGSRGPSSSRTGSGAARDSASDARAESAAAAQRRVGWSELERIVAGDALILDTRSVHGRRSPESRDATSSVGSAATAKTPPSRTPRAWDVGVVRVPSKTAFDKLRGLLANVTWIRGLLAVGAVAACLLLLVVAVELTTDATEDLKPSRARPALASPRGKAPVFGRQQGLPPELPASDATIPSRATPRASSVPPNGTVPRDQDGLRTARDAGAVRSTGARSSENDALRP
jgi:hypothetical protein